MGFFILLILFFVCINADIKQNPKSWTGKVKDKKTGMYLIS